MILKKEGKKKTNVLLHHVAPRAKYFFNLKQMLK